MMRGPLAPSACARPVTLVRPPDKGPSLYHCHMHGWTTSPDGEHCGRLADLNDAQPAAPGECDVCGAALPTRPYKVVAGIASMYGVACSRPCADKLRMHAHDDYGVLLYTPVPGVPKGHRYCERIKKVVKMEDVCCGIAPPPIVHHFPSCPARAGHACPTPERCAAREDSYAVEPKPRSPAQAAVDLAKEAEDLAWLAERGIVSIDDAARPFASVRVNWSHVRAFVERAE